MRLFIAAVIAAGLCTVAPVCRAADTAAGLDLATAVRMALEKSPLIGGAGAAADAAEAGVGKARSALYPTLGLQSGYSYLSDPTMFGATPVWERSTVVNRVELQQLLYSGGQAQANVRRAEQGHLAAGHGLRAAQAGVTANVAVAYFRARQASEMTAVHKASVRSLEASYDAAKKRHETGVATKTDVLRAEVALAGARADLIAAENNSAVALAALRTAIGLPADTAISLASGASDEVPGPAGGDALESRPEIAAAEASARAADEGVRAAKASRLPTVALAADYYHEPSGAGFPRTSNTFLAGVVAKLNVFDGGLTRASISEAQAAARKAGQDLEAQKRNVEFEQRSARLNLESAQARLDATATQVSSAEESLRALEAGYKEGFTPLTDVLSGEAALTGARAGRLAAEYDVKIAEVNLLRAFGQTGALTAKGRN